MREGGTLAWFSDGEIRRLAGGRSYERGVEYLELIREVKELPDGIVATVQGSEAYRVRLRDDDGLSGECSCPYGSDGNFCKHCVAVSLHLLTAVPEQQGAGRSRRGAKPADVKKYLASLDATELVELIWDHAQHDAALYQKLQLATATTATVPDFPLLRTQVERLHTEWLAYENTYSYTTTAETVLTALAQLTPTHAKAVQPLLRRALKHIGGAASVSDSEDGTVIDVATQAWDHYLTACRAAPPDPVELAGWFLWFRLDGPDWPEVSISDVADLLGEAGVAGYHDALEEVGATVDHWQYRTLREELIAATDDVDALIACLAENLAGPHQYVRIAELLRGENRDKEAIKWLERGHADCRHEPYNTVRLVDLLCELYTEQGRTPDVLRVRQEQFDGYVSERTYAQLREAAESLDRWDAVRAAAHQRMRAAARAAQHYAAETLARVLLAEGETDEAWRVVHEHRCDENTVLAVTAERARSHPADAIAVYRPLVDRHVGRTNNHGYQQAAEYLAMLQPLFAHTGDDFADYLAGLRDRHRRKRNFLAELDRRGLR